MKKKTIYILEFDNDSEGEFEDGDWIRIGTYATEEKAKAAQLKYIRENISKDDDPSDYDDCFRIDTDTVE